MLLAWRLTLAHHLDWWEQRVRRIGERWGWPQAWLHEFIAYRGDPRMTIEEFWVRYVLLRMDAEKVLKPHMSEAEAHTFYTTHDYMLWRNLVHRRHSAWRRVLVTMRGKRGILLEFGCGVAPISNYIRKRKPNWYVGLKDLPSAHRHYGTWRIMHHIKKLGVVTFAWDGAMRHVITAVDVFEHLAEPMKTAASLVDQLNPGGYLHYNIHYNEQANDLDIATKEQLDATAHYLASALHVVWQRGEYIVARKP